MLENRKFLEWRKAYQDAVAETDSRKVPAAIAAAEDIIRLRIEVLPGSPNERGERLQIHDALNELRHMKQDRVHSGSNR
ncbi:MAG TPA: hypothetical protein VFO34_07500 [Candidatus Acidoferrales bacterium]|nr:hypothetical protein [Candidatus Acidoferrales bacterium]